MIVELINKYSLESDSRSERLQPKNNARQNITQREKQNRSVPGYSNIYR